MTGRRAPEAGLDVATAEYDMAALAGTYVTREDHLGRAELVIDRASGTRWWARRSPVQASRISSTPPRRPLSRGVPLSLLWHVVPSYPTDRQRGPATPSETYRAQSYA
ncbi:hypothetical protein AB0D38_14820 [Streptomyces sp. NPDC048279]|uniref:hypothetical protein n=1 Tax=Streptomyces sp. NPDC048279 TaxID=3154714 RepID=UPI00342E0864